MPASFGKVITAMGTASNTLMPSTRTWKQHGQSGMWVSDWYPNIAKHVDEMSMFRSCWADGLNHVGSVCQMNTGSILAGRPSLGAWVTYGLGTANENLPTFVILTDDKEVARRPEELEFRLPARDLSGHAVPPRRCADPAIWRRPRPSATSSSAAGSICCADLNRHSGDKPPEDTELEARLRLLRTGLPHADRPRRKRWT